MVLFVPFVGAALLSLAFAAPTPDSAIGSEVAVSAPNGIVMSDTAALATQTASSVDNGGYNSGSSNSGSWGMSSNSGYNSGSNSGYNSGYNSGSNSGYSDSGSSNYGSGNSWSSSSSTMMMSDSMTTATLNTYMSSATSTALSSYSTPSYGSGSSSWDNSGYNNCVQQCVASYGAPPATYTPSSTSSSSGSSGGNGVTHTVIVAPSQGVLRYVPFAVNASVGDTVLFMWGANNHTVTKSSQLLPCNKTADSPFATGEQNSGFSFTQVVNDTNPTFFYCGTPNHCAKGMFGIINPPNAFSSSSSVSNSLPMMASNDSNVAAMAAYTNSQTANNQGAANWGGSIDMSGMPSWAYQHVAENTMYTRTFLAANPDVVKPDGSVNLGAAGSNPMMIPADITAAFANNADANSSSTSSSAPAETSSSSSSSSGYGNGASSLASPRVLVGAMAVLVTFFAL